VNDDIEQRLREAREIEEQRRRAEEERKRREERADNRPIMKDLHGGGGKGDRPTGSDNE
jgi:hypothetical protein